MKNLLLKTIYMLSRYFLYGFVIQLLFLNFGLAINAKGQYKSIEEVTVSISNEQLTIGRFFKEVQRQTPFKFSYDSKKVDRFTLLSFENTKGTVEEFLIEASKQSILSFRQFNHSIDVKRDEQRVVAVILAEDPVDVSGTVRDENGEPIPGVTVSVPGTTIGTATDMDGNYSLTVPEGSTLAFSFIGYETQNIAVGDRSVIDVVLSEDISSLDEVVVVGYGTQRKSDLTGAVGSVSSESLQQRPTANIEQALSGRIAGVDVSINSGKPGGSPQMRIRGSTSVSNTNDPLYVVDGVMLNVERLQRGIHAINSIDPNSIESIEVLKDASATAIYGARGANGVVLITTKKGNIKGGRVSFDSYVSVGTVARRMDLMNSEEFLMIEEIAYQNALKFDPEGFARGNYINPVDKRQDFIIGNNQGNPELFDENLNPIYDTDWQDEAFQDAITHNHSLSFAGGNEQTNFGLYLNYRDEDGVMKDSWLNRYSGRFVINSEINNWLSVGGNISYNVQSERDLSHWAYRAVYQNIPIIPVKFPDGTWARGETYPGVEGPNQRQVAVGDSHIIDTKNTLANMFTNIEFREGLELRTMVATNIVNQAINRYSGRNVDWVSQNQGGIASLSSTQRESWQFENILTYLAEIEDTHTINALLGQSLQTSGSFSSSAVTWGFLDDYFQYNNLGIGSNPRPSTSSADKYSMISFFGRVNYTYNNKYLSTVTGRVDGSSKFGANNKYAFFPSLAIGWLLTEEKFLQNSRFISNLKIRSSYGLTGNSEISNYQYEAGLGTYTAIFDGSRNMGIGVERLANPELKWETNAQFDIGLELGLFDNRISLEADVYHRVSRDMLLARPVPRTSGYATVMENIGNMENRGLELAVTTFNINASDFSWSTIFNWTMNRNKVLKLHGGSDILMGSVPGGTPGSIISEGMPVNTFVGYNRLGTWGTDEEDEAAIYNRRPGDIKYEDVNNDGVITSEDWLPIGNGLPDGYGTLINTFAYKSFEMSIDLQFMYGNDVMWEITQVIEDRTGAYNNMARTVLNAWTPENQNTPIAQNKPLQVGYDTNNDTHRLKDGSFIRGRNLALSYTFPQEWLNSISLRNLRIYTSAQNFFLISKFPGYDPELSTTTASFSRGRGSFDDYPKARVFMVGVNLEF
ncbi:MAG: TonB-dependent receptor [Anditalea sp.]